MGTIRRLQQYLKPENNKNVLGALTQSSLYYQLIGLTIFIFSGIVFLMAYHVQNHIKQIHMAVVKEELRSIATIAAFTISGDLVELLQKPEDEERDEYLSLQKTLIRIRQENPKIDDIYIMRKSSRKGQLDFVINAFVAGEDHVTIGEAYDLSQAPEMLHGFEEPAVDKEFMTDKWGQTLSGYAPVKNTKGDVVGIVGIDFAANQLKDTFNQHSREVLIQAIIGLFIILAISLIVIKKIVGRLNNIKYAIEMLLEEKFDVAIHDTGNDEIKALASRVNTLIKKMVTDKEQIFIHSTTGLVRALEARDPYTHGHSAEVAVITDDILKTLQISGEQSFVITFAAVLHDIGKIGISDMVLNKPGKLTDAEFSIIRQHPVIGEKILEGIPTLDEIRDIVRHHHERYDGKGYPDGIAGQDIHIGARIIAVADSFQAMISDRSYRKGMTQELALQELERNKGTQFDPVVVDGFLTIAKFKVYKEDGKN